MWNILISFWIFVIIWRIFRNLTVWIDYCRINAFPHDISFCYYLILRFCLVKNTTKIKFVCVGTRHEFCEISPFLLSRSFIFFGHGKEIPLFWGHTNCKRRNILIIIWALHHPWNSLSHVSQCWRIKLLQLQWSMPERGKRALWYFQCTVETFAKKMMSTKKTDWSHASHDLTINPPPSQFHL